MSIESTVATTRCHAWIIRRNDGETMGFTDHDCDLTVQDIMCRASAGFSAASLGQSTGLSVDNTEAMGALSDAAITSVDIGAGLYDEAVVEIYEVNWTTGASELRFGGTIGQITEKDGLFEAELRGLAEHLNQPRGRVFHGACDASLGETRCGVDLTTPGYFVEVAVETVSENRVFVLPELDGYDAHWFERGTFEVLSGAATGLKGTVKVDEPVAGQRRIALWQELSIAMNPGDQVRLVVGCEKRFETCKYKFNNGLNFQGFPHIPGDDWLMSYPSARQPLDGGRR